MTNRKLIEAFEPHSYQIEISEVGGSIEGRLIVEGKKVGRPAKRLTLHQRGLKIADAKLFKLTKAGEQPVTVSRINSHHGFEQVRFHSDEMLFPGSYRLEVKFSSHAKNVNAVLDSLSKQVWQSARHIFPLVDEPETSAIYNIRYAKN